MSTWTNCIWNEPATVELLRKLAAERKSAGQIARDMSAEFKVNLSRNAIIGKMRRLGIELQGKAGRPQKPEGQVSKPTAIRRARVRKAPQIHVRANVVGEPKPLGDVDTGCRWLHSDDPRERNFCGHDKLEQSPYCEHHHARCFNYIAPSDRRKFRKFTKFAASRYA